MRKSIYSASEEAAWELFAREPYLDVAGVGPDGIPILRTFNAVAHGGALYFHCGARGENQRLFGQTVTVQVRRPLTVVPSYFVDPRMACPATTYFLSAQARGVLKALEAPEDKARGLSLLMSRHQPEGRHAPIEPTDAAYARALRHVTVARLLPEHVVAKHKFGQNRSARVMRGVIEGLWQRGAPGDLEAIRLLCEQHPGKPCPSRWQPLPGVRLCVRPDAADARQLAPLLLSQYWWDEGDPCAVDTLVAAHEGTSAWVVARHAEAGVIGSARAHGDGARHAYVMDVVVAPSFRGRGLGQALMETLLDHPRVRNVQRLELRTRDQQRFYARLGFEEGPPPFATMVRTAGHGERRDDAAPAAASSG